jgi:putative redox protein
MEVTTHRGQGPLQQVIEIGRHRLLTDVKPEFGGEDSGPEPHDLLAAALAACTTLTVSLYAKRKGYPLDEMQGDHQATARKARPTPCTAASEYVGALDAKRRPA